jgi:hypothetical protein
MVKVASLGFVSFSDGTCSGDSISNNLRMPQLSTQTLHAISTILCSCIHIRDDHMFYVSFKEYSA